MTGAVSMRFWKDNKVDQQWEMPLHDVADKFLASPWADDLTSLERSLRRFLTAWEAQGGLQSVFEEPDFDQLYDVVIAKREAVGDRGSVLTSLVLFVCIFGALLLLAAGYGQAQRAMCALNHNNLRYCPGYSAGEGTTR